MTRPVGQLSWDLCSTGHMRAIVYSTSRSIPYSTQLLTALCRRTASIATKLHETRPIQLSCIKVFIGSPRLARSSMSPPIAIRNPSSDNETEYFRRSSTGTIVCSWHPVRDGQSSDKIVLNEFKRTFSSTDDGSLSTWSDLVVADRTMTDHVVDTLRGVSYWLGAGTSVVMELRISR